MLGSATGQERISGKGLGRSRGAELKSAPTLLLINIPQGKILKVSIIRMLVDRSRSRPTGVLVTNRKRIRACSIVAKHQLLGRLFSFGQRLYNRTRRDGK